MLARRNTADAEEWRIVGSGIGLALAFTGLGFSLSVALRRPWIAVVGTAAGLVTGSIYVHGETGR